MKYFASLIRQYSKEGERVCGDCVRCLRTGSATYMVLCDGIGSGIYANIAAITCAERLCQLFRSGRGFRSACATVADSMHRAHSENIPYSAFTAVKILPDGNFTAYGFQSPSPLLLRQQGAEALQPVYFPAGMEVIAAYFGMLDIGQHLLLLSDGITESGMGRGYSYGIGSQGVAQYLTVFLRREHDAAVIADKLLALSRELSGGICEDDSTVAVLTAAEPERLAIASGPPADRQLDDQFVRDFMKSPGSHIVCGSTTTDIVSRVLGRSVYFLNRNTAGFVAPPEYRIEGIEMVTEGAMMLNQVCNILDEPWDNLQGGSAVVRLARFLRKADVITFFHGQALNDAHEDMLFKQVGVRSRRAVIALLRQKLEALDKLVIILNY